MRKILAIIIVLVLSTQAFAPVLQKPLMGRQINWAHPLSEGLVGYWLMNESSGDRVQDLSGNGKMGTLAGNASWETGFILCEDFGDKISMDTPAFVQAGTIMFSFIGSGSPHTSGKFVVTTDAEFQFFRNSNSTEINLFINGTAGVFTVGDLWGDNNERIIAITWDASINERKVYIDGILKGTVTDAFTWDAANLGSTFYIGDRGNDQRSIGGRFGWCNGYKRTLSASEIAQLYQEPFAMFKPSFRPNLMFVAPAGVVVTPYYYRALIPFPFILFAAYYLRGRKCDT